jgi:hypothetical protein
MGLLSRLFRRKCGAPNALVGCWHLVRPSEEPFEPDGTLTLELEGEGSRFRRGPKLAPKV